MSNRTFAAALASALADFGVTDACISPGSRNTPLIAGFAAEDRIRKWPLLDERSAGFFAIGLAKATGSPVVLTCTSGTAAAEYHPAVVEASQSDIPLIVLTADRPEELRGVGAPQTIDQLLLYGSAVRWFRDAAAPDATTEPETPAALAAAAWIAAISSPPGPIHLNLPFREPLLDAALTTETISTIEMPQIDEGSLDLADIGHRLDGRRGLIVAGQSTNPNFPTACAELAARTGWPIMADPLSGLRFGTHPLGNVLSSGDLLAGAGALESLVPEVVVRFGPVPTSKAVWTWLERHKEIDQILIDLQGRDSTQSAATTLELPPTTAAAAIAAGVTRPAQEDWLESWNRLDIEAADRVTTILLQARFPNEPRIAAIVATAAPAGSMITIGSSMPIRDFDSFGGMAAKPLCLFGNRGANGIDGVVSAALGTAATGRNAIVILGDISLFHDLNALGTAVQLDLPVSIIVINNNGGGIFHFLPQHDPDVLDPVAFETYLATPHGTDFVPVAEALGLAAHRVTDPDTLARLVATPSTRPQLIQIETNRDDNLKLHRSIAADLQDLLR